MIFARPAVDLGDAAAGSRDRFGRGIASIGAGTATELAIYIVEKRKPVVPAK
jgi:hypothetical protein